MVSLSTLAQNYREQLSGLYAEEEITQLFRIALEKTAAIPFSRHDMARDAEIQQPLADKMMSVLGALRTGRPIQHILGEAPFYGMMLQVSEDTLIPRPETEELVHLILQRHETDSELRLIDIGTGTGCIALALSRKMERPTVWAMDISDKALAVAKANAARYKQPVHFLCGDILEWDVVFDKKQRFDIVVSNPPYITPEEKKHMHKNVLDFEPDTALFVPPEAPLLFYDYIADFSLAHLAERGCLYVEINQYLGEETASLLRKKGFSDVRLHKDLNGADRIISAKAP